MTRSAKLSIRVSEDLHLKLRWLSFTRHESQQQIVATLLEEALGDVTLPEEAKLAAMPEEREDRRT